MIPYSAKLLRHTSSTPTVNRIITAPVEKFSVAAASSRPSGVKCPNERKDR